MAIAMATTRQNWLAWHPNWSTQPCINPDINYGEPLVEANGATPSSGQVQFPSCKQLVREHLLVRL
jgi:hypothetical protein